MLAPWMNDCQKMCTIKFRTRLRACANLARPPSVSSIVFIHCLALETRRLRAS